MELPDSWHCSVNVSTFLRDSIEFQKLAEQAWQRSSFHHPTLTERWSDPYLVSQFLCRSEAFRGLAGAFPSDAEASSGFGA